MPLTNEAMDVYPSIHCWDEHIPKCIAFHGALVYGIYGDSRMMVVHMLYYHLDISNSRWQQDQ